MKIFWRPLCPPAPTYYATAVFFFLAWKVIFSVQEIKIKFNPGKKNLWGTLTWHTCFWQLHSQDLPGWKSRSPGRPKWGRKFETKWEKIQENREMLRKCSWFAHLGVRDWLWPWFLGRLWYLLCCIISLYKWHNLIYV